MLASGIRMFYPDPASKELAKPVWNIPLLCVQYQTPDDGQRNCPKHVEIYSKNTFEKLVLLVGFILKLQWLFEAEKKSTNGCFKLYIYLRTK